MIELPSQVVEYIPVAIDSVVPLTGGSICHTYKLSTNKQQFVLKHLANAKQDFFQCEQNGLQKLATTNCFSTPTVHLVGDDFILMEYIEPVTQHDWAQLGKQLANLHQQKHSQYGYERNNYLATIPQNNAWQDCWLDFYRQQRLMPLINHTLFDSQDRKQWDKLLIKMEQFIDNSEPATLIHGDLWQTNIIFSSDDIVLIDPAVYYASREIEIAYLEFVGDARPALLSSYQQTYPLSSDYAERKNFYLLYPYLVHLQLFGEMYLPGIRNILRYYI